jgi:hypothetical protein
LSAIATGHLESIRRAQKEFDAITTLTRDQMHEWVAWAAAELDASLSSWIDLTVEDLRVTAAALETRSVAGLPDGAGALDGRASSSLDKLGLGLKMRAAAIRLCDEIAARAAEH